MSHASIDSAAPAAVPVKFSGAVLVCGDCEHRGSGPKKLRAGEVRKALKRELGGARFKTRIVQSSCLGLCPRKAMALAAIQPGVAVLAAEVRTEAQVEAFAGAVLRSSR